ncbi:MAG: AMP-binding protein [Deltaproteobacteria bacterium]|nr:AMP-binding protein [Deltaproteobacteria bacterium]
MDGETFRDALKDSFRKRGRKRAIVRLRDGEIETVLSYAELLREMEQMAGALREWGVGKGDRVVFFMPKCLFFVVAHLALQDLGAISVPLNPGFKKSEMAYLLADADPKLVIVGPEQQDLVREIAPRLNRVVVDTEIPYTELDFFRSRRDSVSPIDLRLADPALIIYTSGTTGNPKGAVLTQGNLVHDARNIVQVWEIVESDVLCHALPLFHVHGLCFALHTALMAGSTVLLMDRFAPKTVIGTLKKREGREVCTVYMAVPAMYSVLMDFVRDDAPDFSHIRLWASGSAPLLVKDFERIKKTLGREPVEREGMSETGMNFSNPLHGARKPGSIGRPLPDLEVRIVDPNSFKDMGTGETGEIWLKGPCIISEYWRKPEETSKTFEQGWFRTGDLGHMDEEGYYYLTDRIKHIIISGGENVSPKEVETVINRAPGVMESSVAGVPDEKWGEKVVAAVVLKPGSDTDENTIFEYCKEHLHNWKCPKDIRFIDKLPKNTMGKVLKDQVRQLFEA